MENFDGTIGSITTAVLQCGLKPTTKLQLVAVKDIGAVAVGVFKNPEPYEKKVLVITGDFLTMQEQQAAYQRATGRPRPAIPATLARILLAINSHTRDLINVLERVYEARTSGAMPELESQIELAKKAYPNMQTFEEWAKGKL
ncbi:hypothetical protein EWM64_g7911 [Hericium alpestre]|uniref:NmrA-like domain-containing protein n=1 Tax=Hericium alpestre TaxID=135208 RepID=A0A4Y9ZRJ0_9AGAM|nr:hypothetical protein EWM64_g7911 [Hericium alpestre]